MLLLNIICALIFLVPLMLAAVFRYRRKQVLSKTAKHAYTPNVTVIVPFKGEDYNFENTIKSLIHQDYLGKYEVIFVSSDQSGRSIDLLQAVSKSSQRISYVRAESANKERGDKINNMLTGIHHSSSDTEVFLFMDSDMVAHKKWITNMVLPLQIEDCGLSSGTAWVVARTKSTWELATRFWDFLAATQVAFPFTSFARGLSMGIRKDTFIRLNIEKVWNTAFHDNFTLSKAVRKYGLKIYYAPYCVIEEHFELTSFEWISWVKRQSVHTKSHYKKLWAFGFFLVTLPRLLGAILFLTVACLSIFQSELLTEYISFTLWPLFHFVNALAIIYAVYPDTTYIEMSRGTHLEKMKLVLASYYSILLSLGSVWAVFSSKIEWRKIKYKNNVAVGGDHRNGNS